MDLITRIADRCRRRISVRAYLAASVVAIIAPTLAIIWWLANLSAAAVREQSEKNILLQASEISAFVDLEIVSAQTMLVALAGSPYLQSPDFEAFHRQASRAARQFDARIVLYDLGRGEPLLDTAVSWGESPARESPLLPRAGAEEATLRAGAPAVSDVIRGPSAARHPVAVTLPATIDAAAGYLLSARISAERLAEIVDRTRPAAGHLVTIADRQGAVVAGTDRRREFVGTTPPADRHGRTVDPLRTIVKGKNLDGVVFLWGDVRSAASGWTVSVGLPDGMLEEEAKRVSARLAGAGGGVLLIAFVGAYAIGGRIARSMGVLGIDRAPTQEEFRILFESAPNGVVVVDGDGKIALVNAQMEMRFGYAREELVGQPVEILVPERLRGGHLEFRTAFARASRTRPMDSGHELLGRRKDGSEFPVEIGLNPISTVAGNLVMATVVDITARKRAAARLTAALAERDDFRRRFMQALEDERLRLARELHDQTGQSLAAVMLELKGLESLVDECDRDRFRRLRLRLEQLGRTLHQVAWELRPASIDELGLASALGNYISEWSEQYGVEADFHCGDGKLDELSDEARTTIYRLVQEGLTNIARHARGATSVSVVIDRAGTAARLTIEDDGPGFDTAAPDDPSGGRLGLAGMRERLSLIGGEFEIESSIDVGTTIFARIPLERERTAA